ncbi:MAG: protein translocase subunit SecF [Candidatus Nitronauta litoralis]|uniref:Protein-export membrane protein SecF n=1 Tax=Candidatus Nitronauta litoralis TaxID=2705533 RepID=A0A7T0BSY2_9BACT|nr:MAG: protein translocase subunit SecF [Candidatus Nitronauta litoralis]
MEIFKETSKIDFMGKRKLALGISGLLIVISLVSIAFQGGLSYGIDFAGGTLVQLRFKSAPSVDSIRTGLKEIGLGDSTIQEFGSKNEILIRTATSSSELKEVGSRIKDALLKGGSEDDIIVDRVELVGPKVGADLREKALLSIVYAIAGILIYISWRFEFQFAIAAVLALMHDVMITMGVFSILNIEFTLVVVAGFLTLIGYSLNDTIVVFDRIRENTRRQGKETLENMINLSVNQTLSRTLLTSGTTLLVVIALFVLGGEIIHDFSLTLLVGVAVGTYSSIFIASVFLVYWESKRRTKKRA